MRLQSFAMDRQPNGYKQHEGRHLKIAYVHPVLYVRYVLTYCKSHTHFPFTQRFLSQNRRRI